jgi:hypothetical protein
MLDLENLRPDKQTNELNKRIQSVANIQELCHVHTTLT